MTTLVNFSLARHALTARWTHAPVSELIVRILDQLWLWQQRYNERRKLLRMDDRILKDIGLSRADIDGEARKPFWRA